MEQNLLDVVSLTHKFRLGKHDMISAVEDVSFSIRPGEVLGLAGESGSGKSTIAKCVMNLYQPDQGHIYYQGIDTANPKEARRYRKQLAGERQIIFQDSASSLNPRMRIADIICEPIRLSRRKPQRESMRAEAAFWLAYTGMDEYYLDAYPGELSGGQRQRVAIARALAAKPKLIVADEPISSLDVSVQGQIMNLFLKMKQEQKVSMLFISHDLIRIRYLCDRIGVMHQGKLVELAESEALFCRPKHIYTKQLLAAIPAPYPEGRRNSASLFPYSENECSVTSSVPYSQNRDMETSSVLYSQIGGQEEMEYDD